MTARGVIVYMDNLAPRAALPLTFKMTARMPLKAAAAPTTAYLYFQPDRIAAAKPAMFKVTGK